MMVLAAAAPLGHETVEVSIEALGRVLGEDVLADEPVPTFDNASMDGFAVRRADVREAAASSPVALEVVGESRAGSPAQRALGPGEAVAISTGAMLPAGGDAVVRVEDTRVRAPRVEILRAPAPAQNVRRAGEDVRAGATVLRRGATLGPAELGVLASLGRPRVQLSRRPAVTVLVSGDELLSPAQAMRPGGVRDTSSLTIPALVRQAGALVSATGRLADEADATRAGIAAALAGADVVIVCGGVSVGTHDHVRPALRELGAEQVFWRVALRPGGPLWFGTMGSTLVFGLPGNPVSAMVTFVLFVGPALRALLGARDGEHGTSTAALACDYRKQAGRAHALRCRLSARADGWHAEPTGAQGSHILSSMLGADALAIIPTDATHVSAGDEVRVEPLRRWGGLGL